MRRKATALLAVAVSCAAALTGTVQATSAAGAAPAARAAVAPATGHFTAVTPVRALDTRTSSGIGQVASKQSVTFSVANDVPVGATSVVVNLTATHATQPGYLTAYAAGTPTPGVSSVNFVKGQTVANLATVGTGGNAREVQVYNGSTSPVDVIADVSGYFAPGAIGQGTFAQVTPTRVLDTRQGIGSAKAAIGAHKSVALKIATGALVPADASAVLLNVTATSPTQLGYATAYPTGSAVPGSSNLNFARDATAADLVVVPIGDASSISIYNGSSGTTHFIADVQGYLAGGDPTMIGGLGALTPSRLLDTRNSAAVGAQSTVTLNVLGRGGVPAEHVATTALTVTATDTTSAGFLSVYGGPAAQTAPATSDVNFAGTQTVANSVVVAPDSNGLVTVYNGSLHAVDVLVDVTGYGLGADLSVPPTTASHYTTNFSKLAGEGTTDGASGASLVLLDVGAQSVTAPGLSKPSPGVVLARLTPRYAATYSALVAALTKYVQAFGNRTAGPPARIAIGTNTDGTFTGTNGYDAATRGTDWAKEVIAPLQKVAGSGVTIVGANDVEAGFAATEAQAEQWETAFLAADSSVKLIYNGSADACPDTYDATLTAECQPVKSDDGTHPWTRANYVRLAYGLSPTRITVLPQIYFANHANQAAQWANINATSGGRLKFEGALSQRPICAASDYSCGYTGSEAWAALYHALSTQSADPTSTSPLNIATELHST